MAALGLTSVSEDDLRAFVLEVRAALDRGARHATPGFGTFSTCTRKAVGERPRCTMAMFRASAALRESVSNGRPAEASGAHASVVTAIAAAMQGERGLDVPQLGHFGVVRVAGKKPRLIFHADQELNDSLTGALR